MTRKITIGVAFCMLAAILSAGCGNSSAPTMAINPGSTPAGTGSSAQLGPCTSDAGSAQTAVSSLLPSRQTVESRNRAADQFGNGFRIGGNAAEEAYIDYLADQFKAIGASDVAKEPYTFTAWSAKTTSLQELTGPKPGAINVAYYIPASGSTGSAGVTGQVVYLSALSSVNLAAVVTAAIQQQDPSNLSSAIQAAIDNSIAGGNSLAQVIAAANVTGKIVMYDVPKVGLSAAVFYGIATYVNNTSGTMPPNTPYSRPYIDMLAIPYINDALKAAGAIGIISVIDYPPEEADLSYYPFGAVPSSPGAPGIYLDRDTGNQLKQQLDASGSVPLTAKLVLDASQGTATSYNVVATVPGQCTAEILVSSHSDGPNSIEDDGPAAILSIVEYFANAPVEQRHRTLRAVISGGHFEGAFGAGTGPAAQATFGSPGMVSYIAAHQADLTANTLTAIEIEHLGAREWLELSPGSMGLTGLPELGAIWTTPGSAQSQAATTWAENFDRTFVTTPLPFGEGGPWSSEAGLPLIQYIPGPVYLLNGPTPEVSDRFTDYDVERRQIDAFVQMILDLDAQTSSTLRLGANHLP